MKTLTQKILSISLIATMPLATFAQTKAPVNNTAQIELSELSASDIAALKSEIAKLKLNLSREGSGYAAVSLPLAIVALGLTLPSIFYFNPNTESAFNQIKLAKEQRIFRLAAVATATASIGFAVLDHKDRIKMKAELKVLENKLLAQENSLKILRSTAN